MSKISKINKNYLRIETGDRNDMEYEQINIFKTNDGVLIETTYDGTYGSNRFILTKEQITQFISQLQQFEKQLT